MSSSRNLLSRAALKTYFLTSDALFSVPNFVRFVRLTVLLLGVFAGAQAQVTPTPTAPSSLPTAPAPGRQMPTNAPTNAPAYTQPGNRNQPALNPNGTRNPANTTTNPSNQVQQRGAGNQSRTGANQNQTGQPNRGNATQRANAQNANGTDAQNADAEVSDETRVRDREAQTPEEVEKERIRRRVFGYSIFNGNGPISFEPNPRLSAPPSYVIGPDDVLNVLMYGYSEMNQAYTVNRQGNIIIPLVGAVSVGGLTLTQAEDRIRGKMAGRYAGLRNSAFGPQNTYLRVTIDQVRTIRIQLVGEVARPGDYNVSSLTTVYNALYNSGGPTEIGSFRTIQLLRKDKVLRTIDLYPYLLTGQRVNDISLQDDDVIFVPAYKTRVDLNGEVKKPGLFEALPGETLGKLIEYAGGFTEIAYRAKLKLIRLTDRDRRLIDVDGAEIDRFPVQNADVVAVEQIMDRYNNVVFVRGAVFRPGQYPLDENPTLRKLVERAEGITPDAFTGRVQLTRRKSDLTYDLLSFDLAKILSGEAADIPLQREDNVEILSISQLRQNRNVRIQGNVLNPLVGENSGYFPWYEGMTIEDLIIAAGGLTESASTYNVEVLRPVRKNDSLARGVLPEVAQTFQVSISRDLKKSPAASTFILQPFDQVYVRTVPNFQEPQFVEVQGQVVTPGPYGITNRDERITDVLKRAGGLTQYAYVEGATLTRRIKLSEAELKQRQQTIAEISDDSQRAAVQADPLAPDQETRVGINLQRILNNPHSEEDLILQDGDVINIPKQLQTVRIGGEVLYPNTARFTPGAPFLEYISRAGGFTAKSIKRRSYVVYANGNVRRTRRFLFFNSYPRVDPGSEIIVPLKTKADLTAQQILTPLQQTISGLAALTTILVLLRNFK
jgi:protein involved in polysaccharide export with SLBB domain